MKLSLSLLFFFVIEVANCIQIIYLCSRNQRDAYESTDSRSILEYNLSTLPATAEALHTAKEPAFYFQVQSCFFKGL